MREIWQRLCRDLGVMFICTAIFTALYVVASLIIYGDVDWY